MRPGPANVGLVMIEANVTEQLAPILRSHYLERFEHPLACLALDLTGFARACKEAGPQWYNLAPSASKCSLRRLLLPVSSM